MTRILHSWTGLVLWGGIALLVLGGWLAHPALAAPANVGSIDRTFGVNGIVTQQWPLGITSIADSTLQADGKIVVVGGSANRSNTAEQDIFVARYTVTGTLDTAFGSGGMVFVPVGAGLAVGNAMAIQADGKIVAAGFVQNSGAYSVALARLNSDGSLDNTFGSGGIVATSAGGTTARGVGIALQADGKLLVAGTKDNALAVFRFNSNGTLDKTFGGSGVATTTFTGGGAGESIATTVALQADGKILAAGGTPSASDCLRGAIVRFLTDGTPDNSFGSGGKVYYPRTYEFFKIAVQSNQKFVAVSSTYDCKVNPNSLATVARFNADGTDDSSFSGGFRNFPDTSTGRIMGSDLLLAPDNSIWVAAFDTSAPFIAALRTDGTMNPKFGTNGIVRTTLSFAAATTISMQNDGKVIIGALNVEPNYSSYGRMARYQTPLTCIYQDVCADDFFNEAVRYLTQHGVISGYDDGTFRPYNNTTRAQMAKIVTLAFNLPRFAPPSGQTFADVPPSDPFFAYIETLAHNNIVSGDSCGQGCLAYHPGSDITRGQLSKIITLAAGWTLLNPATPHFSDVAADNTFYTYIETAVAHGVISGYSNGAFGWTASATRGQIAKIVYLSIPHTEKLREPGSDKSTK